MAHPRSEYPNSEMLVETDWLAQHLGDENVRIVDSDVWDASRKAHIQGAVGIRDHYWKNPYDPTHVVNADQFSREMSSLGISNNTLVVAYDSSIGQHAGRLWWVFRYYGHRKVRVLNGGWKKWCSEGRPFSLDEPSFPPGEFIPKVQEDILATGDYVKAALQRKGVILVDVREDHEYTGTRPQRSDVRQFRMLAVTPALRNYGHIPGAVHLKARYVLTERPWIYKPADELLQMFTQAGVTPEKEIITYCYGGARSGQGLLVLKLLGYERVRLFDGGWNEWGVRDDVPIER